MPKFCSQNELASAELARLVIRRVPPMLDLRPTCTLLTRCSFSTRLPTSYVRVILEAHGCHITVKKMQWPTPLTYWLLAPRTSCPPAWIICFVSAVDLGMFSMRQPARPAMESFRCPYRAVFDPYILYASLHVFSRLVSGGPSPDEIMIYCCPWRVQWNSSDSTHACH
jgi:hypothetical protein